MHPAIPAILGYCLDPRVLPWCHIWCHIVPLLRWRTCDVLSRNISETSSASGDVWSQTANFSGAPKPRSFDSRFRDLTSRHLRAVLSIHHFWKRKRWALGGHFHTWKEQFFRSSSFTEVPAKFGFPETKVAAPLWQPWKSWKIRISKSRQPGHPRSLRTSWHESHANFGRTHGRSDCLQSPQRCHTGL